MAFAAGRPRFKSQRGQQIINFFFSFGVSGLIISSFNFHVNKIMMPRFDMFQIKKRLQEGMDVQKEQAQLEERENLH